VIGLASSHLAVGQSRPARAHRTAHAAPQHVVNLPSIEAWPEDARVGRRPSLLCGAYTGDGKRVACVERGSESELL
jgi:hypothetical protein